MQASRLVQAPERDQKKLDEGSRDDLAGQLASVFRVGSIMGSSLPGIRCLAAVLGTQCSAVVTARPPLCQ